MSEQKIRYPRTPRDEWRTVKIPLEEHPHIKWLKRRRRYTYYEIAKMYNVTYSTIYRICNPEFYKKQLKQIHEWTRYNLKTDPEFQKRWKRYAKETIKEKRRRYKEKMNDYYKPIGLKYYYKHRETRKKDALMRYYKKRNLLKGGLVKII